MLSLRARLILAVIKRNFNVNPFTCSDQVAHIMKLNGPDKYKAPKGFTREKAALSHSSIEFVKPEVSGNNLIYILHGGAYIASLTDLYRRISARYSAAGGGAAVAFLDYRVSPKDIYPSALNDALEGWEELLKRGYKAGNITVVGDSAGGNLTLALMLKLRDMGKEMPRCAVCMSPWADMTASGDSYLNNFPKDVMFGGKGEVSREMVDKLLQSPIYGFIGKEDRKNPYISPVFGDYAGFPPMMFTVGSDEILLSDTITIKEKLDKAGVKTELFIGERMFHVWPIYYSILPEARKAMDAILEFIKKAYA